MELDVDPEYLLAVIKLPKSSALPVDEIVIKSIVSVGFGPGSAAASARGRP